MGENDHTTYEKKQPAKLVEGLKVVLLIALLSLLPWLMYNGCQGIKANNIMYADFAVMDEIEQLVSVAFVDFYSKNNRCAQSIAELQQTGLLGPLPICPYTQREYEEVFNEQDMAQGTVRFNLEWSTEYAHLILEFHWHRSGNRRQCNIGKNPLYTRGTDRR